MEIWQPKPPGTLWTTPGLLGDCFTFIFTTTTTTNNNNNNNNNSAYRCVTLKPSRGVKYYYNIIRARRIAESI